MLDGGGGVRGTRDYYPFGLPMPGRHEKGSPPTQEDYTGHVKDGETGLHYAGARYYSAAFGRWLKPDPILGTKGPKALLKQDARLLMMTSYNYTFSNPIGLRDPTGLRPRPSDDSFRPDMGSTCLGDLCDKNLKPDLDLSPKEKARLPNYIASEGKSGDCPDCVNEEPIQMEGVVVTAEKKAVSATATAYGGLGACANFVEGGNLPQSWYKTGKYMTGRAARWGARTGLGLTFIMRGGKAVTAYNQGRSQRAAANMGAFVGSWVGGAIGAGGCAIGTYGIAATACGAGASLAGEQIGYYGTYYTIEGVQQLRE